LTRLNTEMKDKRLMKRNYNLQVLALPRQRSEIKKLSEGTTVGYGLDGRVIGFRFLTEEKCVSFLQSVKIGSGAQPAS
jgi:hypothetical protein